MVLSYSNLVLLANVQARVAKKVRRNVLKVAARPDENDYETAANSLKALNAEGI